MQSEESTRGAGDIQWVLCQSVGEAGQRRSRGDGGGERVRARGE